VEEITRTKSTFLSHEKRNSKTGERNNKGCIKIRVQNYKKLLYRKWPCTQWKNPKFLQSQNRRSSR